MGWRENKAKYNAKYTKENYKRIALNVPKEVYPKIKLHADLCGESVNAYIQRAIYSAMLADDKKKAKEELKKKSNP